MTIITLTTVGYGDLSPKEIAGRMFATVLIIVVVFVFMPMNLTLLIQLMNKTSTYERYIYKKNPEI